MAEYIYIKHPYSVEIPTGQTQLVIRGPCERVLNKCPERDVRDVLVSLNLCSTIHLDPSLVKLLLDVEDSKQIPVVSLYVH